MFFIVLNLFFQWAMEGEPGVVAAESGESEKGSEGIKQVPFSLSDFNSTKRETNWLRWASYDEMAFLSI